MPFGFAPPPLAAKADEPAFQQWFSSIYNWMRGNTGVASVSAAYTVPSGIRFVICDTTSAGFTVTLPPVSGDNGRLISIKKIPAANTLTIATSGSDTTDAANLTAANSSFTVVASEAQSAWHVID